MFDLGDIVYSKILAAPASAHICDSIRFPLGAISQGLIFVATFASAFNVKLLSTEGKKVAAEY